jgi:hypothetical protein
MSLRDVCEGQRKKAKGPQVQKKPLALSHCRKKISEQRRAPLSAFIRQKARKGIWTTARPHLSRQRRQEGQRESKGAKGYEGSATEFKIVLKHERVRNFLFRKLRKLLLIIRQTSSIEVKHQ